MNDFSECYLLLVRVCRNAAGSKNYGSERQARRRAIGNIDSTGCGGQYYAFLGGKEDDFERVDHEHVEGKGKAQ